MTDDDSLKLLKECNSGIQMAVLSFDDVLGKVHDTKLKELLIQSKSDHSLLGDETNMLITEHGSSTSEPNMMAKGMSWIKTNMMTMVEDNDKAVADIITDGCNMGIKSLYRYKNQYTSANEKVIDITDRLIRLEETLRQDIKEYL